MKRHLVFAAVQWMGGAGRNPLVLASFGACVLPLHPSDPIPSALQPSVGQVARVDVSSKVEVVWADNSKTIILPQVRPLAT